jgi:hypothetical protein
LGQACWTTVPSPAQVEQGDTDTNCPNIERAARRTSPEPPQVLQVDTFVPGAAPRPPQVAQRSSVRTLTRFVVPVATSARLSFNVTFRS